MLAECGDRRLWRCSLGASVVNGGLFLASVSVVRTRSGLGFDTALTVWLLLVFSSTPFALLANRARARTRDFFGRIALVLLVLIAASLHWALAASNTGEPMPFHWAVVLLAQTVVLVPVAVLWKSALLFRGRRPRASNAS